MSRSRKSRAQRIMAGQRKRKQQRQRRKKTRLHPLVIVLCVLFAVLAAAFLFGCSTARPLPSEPVTLERRDSVRLETVVRETVVHDTVMIRLPAQTAERETRDSVSRLENDYAVSVASIGIDGLLRHSLALKPQGIAVPVDRKNTEVERTLDKETYKEVPVPYAVEVERELSRWQLFRLHGFWVLLSVLLFLCCYKLRNP